MTSLREAATQALEALEHAPGYSMMRIDAMDALRAALAEPQQEPVAWMDIDEKGSRLTVRQWSDGNRDEVRARRAEAQRDALLEALKYHQEQTRPIQRTIDAIKAAEENT